MFCKEFLLNRMSDLPSKRRQLQYQLTAKEVLKGENNTLPCLMQAGKKPVVVMAGISSLKPSQSAITCHAMHTNQINITAEFFVIA